MSNAVWSSVLSQRSLHGPRDHENNSQFHVVVSHLGANLRANDVDQASPGDRAGHLMRYWSGNDRFRIYDGVCILADLADVGKFILPTCQYFNPSKAQMCDNRILADFFTSGGEGHFESLLNVVLNLNRHGKHRQCERDQL